MITKERYQELIEVVNAARPLYMQGAETGISDELYDSYMNDIYEFERWNTPAANSPTQSVNPSDGGDVVHPIPMLSLKDVFTLKDTLDFMKENLIKTAYSIEYKLDGLSVQLIYKHGVLVSASTRGDGKVGIECLGAAKYIDDIPKHLREPADLIVHGEVFMKKSKFNEYCEKYGKQANPRNTAVGIFKRQNELERAKYLSCSVYNIDQSGGPDDFRTHESDMNYLAEVGFQTVFWVIVKDLSMVEELFKDVYEERENLDIPIDGMVVKFDNLQLRKYVGDNGVVPRWAVAYKFPAQEQETRLKGIEWQVGATGKLNPVAILEPVLVMGSTISKATLHNWDRIKQLGIQKNDMVVVYKAGDIIPAIKSTRHTDESVPFEKPTTCPACGATLTGDSDVGVCENIYCREKLLARLNGWTDKKIGNFKGVASSLVEALYERGKLKVPADFYKIKPIEVLTLPGSGNAKMNTYMQRVEESKKNMTFAQILVGLGINNLAQAAAQAIEGYFKTNHPGITYAAALKAFQELPCSRLQDLLGKVKGESVYNQLQETFIQEIIAGIAEVFFTRIL